MLFQNCQVLSQNEIEQIVSSALQLLSEEGCIFDAVAKEVLLQSGALSKSGRIKIPSDVMLDIISEFQETYKPYTGLPNIIMGQASMIHDPILRQSRAGTWDDCQRILQIAQKLTHISSITWGVEPNDIPIAKRIHHLEKVLESSPKPIYLYDVSEENLGNIIENLSEKQNFFGPVRPYHFFQYSFSELKKIELYSNIQQAIYFQSNYHPNLGIPIAGLLALQIAETLAGMYFAVSINSTSPLVLVTANPQEYCTENDIVNTFDFIRYNLALIQLGHYLGLPVAISAINKPTPNFIHSSTMLLQRFLIWIAGAEHILEIGNISKTTFHPLYLILENEWLEYWSKIQQNFENNINIENILQQMQTGKFQDTIQLWPSEIFCYDESELWKQKRTNIPQKIRDQFAREWRELK